jgi:hypothetical protein
MKRISRLTAATVVAGSMLSLMTTGAAGQEPTRFERQLLRLQPGEATTLFGGTYRAVGPTIALVSPSSELATVAVISGGLTQGKAMARAGQALVTAIDTGKPRTFGFDAARLAATMPPQWTAETASPLRQLVATQRRARFWEFVEPAGLNASAPISPQVEAVRQSYLSNASILALRQAAKGKFKALAGLTATRFAEALAAGDETTVADLIDPKPFTDTGAEAGDWQSARLAFARTLTGDAALQAAMATAPVAAQGIPDAFDTGTSFRIQLVARDRAMFVVAVEPLS